MKKIFSMLCVLALAGTVAFAQPGKKGENKENWEEKMRAEKVALLTSELELTESEAQAFWPVYNEVQNLKQEAFRASTDAHKALRKAVKNGAENVEKLLNDYLKAKVAADEIDIEAVARYKKVLSVEKVAKLVLSEEKFRHKKIEALGHGPKGGHVGPRE